MARASLILHRKRYFDDGAMSEIKLWIVPGPVPGSRHEFKYSLYYGQSGERLVGYDNERGKGDHRHYREREEPYAFTTPEQLIADFLHDVRKLRRGRR
ncbi:MAG: hypothetical protein JOZ05_11760 [Acetobacteraceae bacterium]|nr:hypothetical protein [Acetobacteraceae bacterium]